MAAPKPITIVGGGLAGLTLGVGLRRHDIPVTVCEAGRYPRHRVCGEFISGQGQQGLTRLGLREALVRAGAATARTAAFFSTHARSAVRPLPAPALCLSRFTLDALLAQHFRRCGGDLRENQPWRANYFGDGVVRANGRRPQPVDQGLRWFGLKVHARNVPLAADLEMHVLPNGYVGLCRLKDEKVNICGLFRRPAAAGAGPQRWQDMLRGDADSPLRERLAAAHWDEASFCSVAGLCLRPRRASVGLECCLGDALTMIAPVTGNGMSLAFESAELAIEPLAAYSRGETTWQEARRRVARACDNRFARRLTWARGLQWMMFAPGLQSRFGSVVLRSEWLWRMMFARTR